MGPCRWQNVLQEWTKIKPCLKLYRNCLTAPQGAFPLKSAEKTQLDFSHTAIHQITINTYLFFAKIYDEPLNSGSHVFTLGSLDGLLRHQQTCAILCGTRLCLFLYLFKKTNAYLFK